jgi:hypothetical protein
MTEDHATHGRHEDDSATQNRQTEEEDVRERIIQEKLDNKPPTDLPEFPFAVGEGVHERQTQPNLQSD